MHAQQQSSASRTITREEWELLALIAVFLAGFVVSLFVWLWLFVRYCWEEMAWWEIPPTLLEVVMASLTGGVLLTLVVLKAYMWWRRWTGTFQCPCCHMNGRTLGICDRCGSNSPVAGST